MHRVSQNVAYADLVVNSKHEYIGNLQVSQTVNWVFTSTF